MRVRTEKHCHTLLCDGRCRDCVIGIHISVHVIDHSDDNRYRAWPIREYCKERFDARVFSKSKGAEWDYETA